MTGVNSGEYSEENSALDILTSTTYTYTASGEFVTGIIDARGLNTVYAVYETTGLTESITTPATLLGVDKNVITKYTYDIGNHNLLTSGIYSSDDPNTLISGVTYTYNNPLAQLKNITRTDGQKYSFTYDIWGRVTDIKVGTRLLSHSVYRNENSSDTQLDYTEYGNGDRVYYTYDGLDRIIALSTIEGGAPYVSYDYNSEGLVGRVTDNLSGVSAEYHYDLLGRLVSSTLSQGGIDRYFYTYNESNQLTSVSAYLPTGELAVEAEYTYDQSGRLIESAQGEYTVHYTYDVLSRVTCERTVHEDGAEYYTYYSYLEADNGNTTSFVETVTYKTKASGATAETTVGSIHYTYDKNGFISSVTEKDANGNSTSSESYTYDALGQLKTVTRGANVTEYTYDNSGNILSKKVNGTVVGTYTYTDSQWKDLLTSYNGETITYDGIGNPTTYIGWNNLTWSMGRRLTSLSNDSTSITYSYDASGQRVSKTVNGVTTEFYYDDRGVLILSSRSDGTELRFYADADGNIDSFSYNNAQYYYVRNAQNDVIGITDSTGAFVARYTYDEWGNITSITDGQGNDVSANQSHIANINPLRYRSYFYDAETGFYWLNTRYYDPAIGRFINADKYLSTGQGVLGHNMFAYCCNNAICHYDSEGTDCICLHQRVPGNHVCNSEKNKEKSIWDQMKNEDGTYSFYDNRRHDPDNYYHEQILSFDTDAPSFNIISGEIGLGSLSGTVYTGGWEGEYVDLSLLDSGHAEATCQIKDGKVEVSAFASAWSPSASIKFCGITIEVGAEVGAIGGGYKSSANSLGISLAALFGFTLEVEW